MSGAHEGCSQGKSVRDREGSKHSTAATPERVDSEAAVLPQDFEDTVHARQLKALCRRVGRRMSRQGPGRSPSMGLTHLNAARPREKSSGVPHCGSSKILSDLVSHRRATRRNCVTVYSVCSIVRCCASPVVPALCFPSPSASASATPQPPPTRPHTTGNWRVHERRFGRFPYPVFIRCLGGCAVLGTNDPGV